MTELEVFAQGKKIGTAEVEREGLFLEFSAISDRRAMHCSGCTPLRAGTVNILAFPARRVGSCG